MSNEAMLTRAEVGMMLRISTRTVDRLRRDGVLFGLRIGGRRVFPKSELEALMRRLLEEEYHDRGTNGDCERGPSSPCGISS